MAFERPSEGGIDYAPCRYGMSKLLFRGPRRDTSGDYVAFLGSTETYGKFIETPFAERTAELTGLPSVNFGCVNAGVDTFHDDETVIALCRKARACVVQVMGADRMSNRLYSVHARRNDRFVRASQALRQLYPQVDFAEIHFTRHLLRTLWAADPDAFEQVRESLAGNWLTRMESLLARIGVPVILLRLKDRTPATGNEFDMWQEPLFVREELLRNLEPKVAAILEVEAPSFRGEEPVSGMVFADVELPVARGLPGPESHDAVAAALKGPLQTLWALKKKGHARVTMRDLSAG